MTKKGFSFTEIMVAIFILMVGILPIFWFFSRSNVATMRSRDEIMAQHYAAELLDYQMAKGFGQVAETGGQEVEEIEAGGHRIKIEDRFTRTLKVQQVTPEHNSEWPCTYKVISVEVSWMAETQQRSFKMAGMIYAGKE
ncbi:MAG: type IV pilus modification PilV family protein [Candidatus Rifleibacteriota bacterium]